MMPPASWAGIFASLLTVVLFFNVTSLMVRRVMGMTLLNTEIDLFPFR